jgi:UDP-glucose 4-epimerase
MSSDKWVLVTGGAGFIGSHVAQVLLELGKNVLIVDDLSGGSKDNIPEGAEFIQGCILNISLLEQIFTGRKITHIYHLAAYAAEGLSHFIKRYNYENNLIGTVNLINLAVNHDVKCFVFTSSIAVYGDQQPPFTEDMIPMPEDSYGIAKYAVEQELVASKMMFGLNFVIFRPHNVYGENQNIGDRYRNVVGIFMNQILRGESMIIFGDGTQTRAFSYITDVAPAIAHSAFMSECHGQTYNLGSDRPYSVNELAEVVAGNLGVDCRVIFREERQEVKHAYSDHTKSRVQFSDLISDVSLEKGISAMAVWVKKMGARESRKFDGIEITKNMPPLWMSDYFD